MLLGLSNLNDTGKGTIIGEQYGTKAGTLSIPFVSPFPRSPSTSLQLICAIKYISLCLKCHIQCSMPSDGPFQVKFGSAWATPRVGQGKGGEGGGGIVLLYLYLQLYSINYYATSVLAAIQALYLLQYENVLLIESVVVVVVVVDSVY